MADLIINLITLALMILWVILLIKEYKRYKVLILQNIIMEHKMSKLEKRMNKLDPLLERRDLEYPGDERNEIQHYADKHGV